MNLLIRLWTRADGVAVAVGLQDKVKGFIIGTNHFMEDHAVNRLREDLEIFPKAGCCVHFMFELRFLDMALDTQTLLAGAQIVGTVYPLCAVLHYLLPSKKVVGYACDCYTGKPLEYRLNGLLCMIVCISGWLVLGKAGIIRLEFIFENVWGSVFIANILGLLGSLILYLKGKSLTDHRRQPYQRCPTKDRPGKKQITSKDVETDRNRTALSHFFLGQEFNPRFGMFDLKMFLYLVGAVMLGLNVYSAVALQYKQDGFISLASKVYAGLFTHFLCEYMFFEEIHLYTYDLFAEKVGFKLFWGCFVFYPFFYAIGANALVEHAQNVDLSPNQASACVALFYSGWVMTRGANMQKFYFKRDPQSKSCFGGLIQQRTIPNSKILCSGFWRASRHINYMGEITQSIALAIPGWLVSGSLLPWLYPAYYVALFIPRQIDDDAICLEKYGKAWEEYMKLVPYRIVPFVW